MSISHQPAMTRDAMIYETLTEASLPPELIHLVAEYDGHFMRLQTHRSGVQGPDRFDQKISPNIIARIMASFGTLYTEPKGKWYVIKLALVAQKYTFIAVDCAAFGVHLAVRHIFDRKYKKALYEGDLKAAETALRYGCHHYLAFSDVLKLIAAENYKALILLMAQAFNGKKELKAFDMFKSSITIILDVPEVGEGGEPVLRDIPTLTSQKCFAFLRLFLRNHIPTRYYPDKGCPNLDSDEAIAQYMEEKTENEMQRFFSNIFDHYLKNKSYQKAQLFFDYGWDANEIIQSCASSNNDLHTQAPLKIFMPGCTVEMVQFWLNNGLNPHIEIRHPRLNTPLTLLGEATTHNNLPVISLLLQYNPQAEESKSDEAPASLT